MLFDDVAVESPDAVERAVGCVLRRATDLKLFPAAAPWSLCELRLDEADFQWLCHWAQSWPESEAERWLRRLAPFRVVVGEQSFTNHQAVGVLLLLFCAECVRRDGAEGRMWPCLRFDKERKLRFARANDRIFNEVGIVRGRVYRALHRAAFRLGIRHAFRDGDEQIYYNTIGFQFGLTRAGIERLPEWLNGYASPCAVRELRQGRLVSPSFQTFWNSLLDLRQGLLSEAEWRLRCADSPWILPAWSDEICTAARLRRSLAIERDTRAGGFSAPLAAVFDEAENESELRAGADFLEEPRLVFEGDTARWTCAARDFVLPASRANLPDSLEFYLGKNFVGRYFRSNGRRFTPANRSWTIPLVAPCLASHLVNNGVVVARQNLQLWPDCGVALWSLSSGKRLDVWTHVPRGAEYALLVDDDLETLPRPPKYQKVGERTLFFPDAEWFVNGVVRHENRDYWRALKRQEPLWAKNLTLEIQFDGEKLGFGDSFRVAVSHPQELQIMALHGAGRTFSRLESSEEKTAFAGFSIAPDNATTHLLLEIEVRAGDECAVLSRRLAVPLWGALWRENESQSWNKADPDAPWNLSKPRQWKIFGAFENGAMICEGAAPVDLLPARARALKPKLAQGEPLSIRTSPFDGENEAMRLCSSIRNGGEILDLEFQSDWVHLHLAHAFDAGEFHQVFAWLHNGAIVQIDAPDILAQGALWSIENSFEAPLLTLGIAFEGDLIGSWVASNWAPLFQNLAAHNAAELAARARWFDLPLWEGDFARQFARLWPAQTLEAWLGQPQTPQQFHFGPSRRTLVRQAFKGHFAGDAKAAQSLIFALQPTWRALDLLCDVDPFLMASHAQIWAQNYQPRPFAAMIDACRKRLEAKTTGLDIPLSQRRQVAFDACRLWHGELEPPRAAQLESALANDGLRRVVAACLLEDLTAQRR